MRFFPVRFLLISKRSKLRETSTIEYYKPSQIINLKSLKPIFELFIYFLFSWHWNKNTMNAKWKKNSSDLIFLERLYLKSSSFIQFVFCSLTQGSTFHDQYRNFVLKRNFHEVSPVKFHFLPRWESSDYSLKFEKEFCLHGKVFLTRFLHLDVVVF